MFTSEIALTAIHVALVNGAVHLVVVVVVVVVVIFIF